MENDNKLNNNPHISINAQYIKDLSFENPEAPNSLTNLEPPPQIDLSIDLNITRLEEDNFFEVTINIEAKAQNDVGVLFIVDLEYAGIFHLINIPLEQQELALAIQCPSMIFPFARKIVADATQSGGFRPLMIDPIDFAAMYYKKLSETNH
jgi:preprotein translocase subunit SecB